MRSEQEQPTPDELLKTVMDEEAKNKAGKLTIFFGMSAGVGKTYTMLSDAQERLAEGVNVVVGTVNTHGRKETEALLTGLPLIPEKQIVYKGKEFTEFDLEKVLETKPDIVLVDELAHSNVPGSKHPKRWQDVLEILEAGINVYTTLNVQHIESRKDIVENIASIRIGETVPDIILERANNIELIDIPPEKLLERLKEGKVYTGDQSKIAIQNFFQMDHLTALREIALRLTAEKVDHDLHKLVPKAGWKTRERLMTLITTHLSTPQMIRATRRLAFEFDAPWIALYVDTNLKLSPEEQTRLSQHLQLAKELGAEVIITHDLNFLNAVKNTAMRKGVTQLIIGRSESRSLPKKFLVRSLIDDLEKNMDQVDIVILREDPISGIYKKVFSGTTKGSKYPFWISVASFVSTLFFGYLLTPIIGYKTVSFIFLVGALILSMTVGLSSIFLAVALAMGIWYFLLISGPQLILEPLAIYIQNLENVALLAIYFFTIIIAGGLTTRIRKQDAFLQQREEKIGQLYEILREIDRSKNISELHENVTAKLQTLFSGEFDIITTGRDNQLILKSKLPFFKEEREQSAAIWSFRNRKMAGWSTDTLPAAAAIYFPIYSNQIPIGVLVYHPYQKTPLTIEQINFLQTVTDHLGLYLEKDINENIAKEFKEEQRIEKLYKSIHKSIVNEITVPAGTITDVVNTLKQKPLSPDVMQLFTEIELANQVLRIAIENILTMSVLESELVKIDIQLQPIKKLILESLEVVKQIKTDREIKVVLPEEDLFFYFDYHLLRIALSNLLLNSMRCFPKEVPIQVEVQASDQEYEIAVVNNPIGKIEDLLSTIFETYYMAKTSDHDLGLELNIVKTVAKIHGGRVEVKERDGKAIVFSIILKARVPPPPTS